ncbi:red domain-containing protein [Bacillus sp. OxB-1]|uniref:RDD family protein n=1 Tax=Bacillus sp. (strain OxB-1) TaxID=98228 RepID=UPI00058205EE|nr:RDD family protein [Bacillus sp. OxB-1]BAQ11756.1 red domain-containing protein [Bacillus sp. OxB-1]
MTEFQDFRPLEPDESQLSDKTADSIETGRFHLKYAGFWTRFWAYVIDLLVVSAISGILLKPAFHLSGMAISNPPFFLFSPYKLTTLAVFLLYFALMTKLFRQTIGKMILGIRVDTKDGRPLDWGTVLFREVIGRFISKMILIPYLLAALMPKKEALHDLFADTVVVHEDSYEKTEELPVSAGRQ